MHNVALVSFWQTTSVKISFVSLDEPDLSHRYAFPLQESTAETATRKSGRTDRACMFGDIITLQKFWTGQHEEG